MKTASSISLYLTITCFASIFFTGCDNEQDEGQEALLPLALAISPVTVVSVNPASGTSGSGATDFTIAFSDSLDGTTMGTVTINGLKHIHGTNCTMSFDSFMRPDDVVIVTPYDANGPGVILSGISVAGFRDPDGKLVRTYRNPDYTYTTL